MIAVADTSPLCYLVLIGEIELLPALFAEARVEEGDADHEEAGPGSPGTPPPLTRSS